MKEYKKAFKQDKKKLKEIKDKNANGSNDSLGLMFGGDDIKDYKETNGKAYS